MNKFFYIGIFIICLIAFSCFQLIKTEDPIADLAANSPSPKTEKSSDLAEKPMQKSLLETDENRIQQKISKTTKTTSQSAENVTSSAKSVKLSDQQPASSNEAQEKPEKEDYIERKLVQKSEFKYPWVIQQKSINQSTGNEVNENVVADHFIVKVKDGSEEEFEQELSEIGAQVRKRVGRSGIYLVNFPIKEVEDYDRMYESLSSLSGTVSFVESDYVITVDSTKINDPRYKDQWSIQNPFSDYHLPTLWQLVSQDAKPLKVAVIDTGVDVTHEDLQGQIWVNHKEIPDNQIDDDNNGFIDDVNGYDFYHQQGEMSDDHGHGTHLAGIIGAKRNNNLGIAGIVTNIEIVPIKFLNEQGMGTVSDAIAGLYYAQTIGVFLTNNSWGSGARSELLYEAFKDLSDSGIVNVAAAGNDGLDNDTFPHFPSNFDLENLIAVGATEIGGGIALYSNYGKTTVDILAPGSDLWSTWPGNEYKALSGTSMSCAFISGILTIKEQRNIMLGDKQSDEFFSSYSNSDDSSSLSVYGDIFDLNDFVDSNTSAKQPLGMFNNNILTDENGEPIYDEKGLIFFSDAPEGVEYNSISTASNLSHIKRVHLDIPLESDAPRDVIFSNDGQKIYVAFEKSGHVEKIDFISRQVEERYELDAEPVAVELSPNSQYLMTANYESYSYSLINLHTSDVQTISTGSQKPYDVEFTPDGDYAVIAVTHQDYVEFIVFSMVSLSEIHVIQTYSNNATTYHSSPGHKGTTIHKRFYVSANGDIIYFISSDLAQIQSYNLETGSVVGSIPIDSDYIYASDYHSGQNKIVIGNNNKKIFIYDINLGALESEFDLQHSANYVKFGPEADIIFVDEFSEVNVYDIQTKAILHSISDGYVVGMSLSHDLRKMYICDYNSSIVNLSTWSTEFIPVNELSSSFAVSPVSNVAVHADLSFNHDLIYVDFQTASMSFDKVPTGEFPEIDIPYDIKGTEDGRYITSNYISNNLGFYESGNVSTGPAYDSSCDSLALSPSGDIAIICLYYEDKVSVVDMNTKQEIVKLDVPSGPDNVFFDSTGKFAYVASIYGQDKLHIIDIQSLSIVGSVDIANFGYHKRAYDLNESKQKLIFPSYFDDKIEIIDLQNNNYSAIPLGASTYPEISYGDSDFEHIVILSTRNKQLLKLDISSEQIETSLDLSSYGYSSDMVIDPSREHVYISFYSQILIVSIDDFQVVKTIDHSYGYSIQTDLSSDGFMWALFSQYRNEANLKFVQLNGMLTEIIDEMSVNVGATDIFYNDRNEELALTYRYEDAFDLISLADLPSYFVVEKCLPSKKLFDDFPNHFELTFSDNIDEASVDLSDITINGLSSNAMIFNSSDSIDVYFPEMGEGSYSLLVTSGNISNTVGETNSPYSYDFEVEFPDYQLSASSNLVYFQDIPLGGTKDISVHIENIGNRPLSITGIVGGTDHFEVMNSFPLELLAGEQFELEIRFSANTIGQFSEDWLIESDLADSIDLTVMADVTDAPRIGWSTKYLYFDISAGHIEEQSIKVINDGGGNLQVDYKSMSGEKLIPMSENEKLSDEPIADIEMFEHEHVANELIVGFKSQSSVKNHQSVIASSGLKLKRPLAIAKKPGTQQPHFSHNRIVLLHSDEDVDLLKARNILLNDPTVEYVEPNYIIKLNKIPSDPLFSDLYGLHNTGQNGGLADADIDAPEAWNITGGTSTVLVGVIDTGVDYNHPDIVENMWVNPGEIPGNGRDDDGNGYIDDVHGYDFINYDSDPMDDHYHGTHVAGTIAAKSNQVGVVGVAWDVKIVAIKFLGPNGGSTSGAIDSVAYANALGLPITNNSWGGGGPSTALQHVIAQSQLFVAAAGNDGQNTDSYPHYPSSYDLDNIISVAASDKSDQLAYFSNYGVNSVDLAAPGVSILSLAPGNSYRSLNGTSMATPHVAGVAALLYSFSSSMSALEVKKAILDGVDVKSQFIGSVNTAGRLNAFNSLDLVEVYPWLSLTPTSFNVLPFKRDSLTFSVNAMDLSPGQYLSEVVFSTNDPDALENRVTIQANVIGTRELIMSANIIDLGEVVAYQEESAQVELFNSGSDILTIYQVVSQDPELSVDISIPLVLESQGNQLLPFTLIANSMGAFEANLIIYSNSDSNPQQLLTVKAEVVEAPFKEMQWGTLPSSHYIGTSFSSNLMSKNLYGDFYHDFNGNVQLSLVPSSKKSLVITECYDGTPDFVEVQNQSGHTLKTNGWRVVVNESSSRYINSVNPVYWMLPDEIQNNEVLYRTDNIGDQYWGRNIWWSRGSHGWAMILDDQLEVVDFVVWGHSQANLANAYIIVDGVEIDISDAWEGLSISEDNALYHHTLQRNVLSDSDTAADFIWGDSSKGFPNLSPSLSSISSSPLHLLPEQVYVHLGYWEGELTAMGNLAGDYELVVSQGDDIIGVSSPVSFVLDDELPIITMLEPGSFGTIYSNAFPNFSWIMRDSQSGLDLSSLEVFLDSTEVSGNQIYQSGNIFSFQPTSALSDGNHSLMINISDKAGHYSSRFSYFKTDTVGPQIDIHSPLPMYYSSGNITISANFSDTISGVDLSSGVVVLNEKEITVPAINDNILTFIYDGSSLQDGDQSLSISFKDLLGHKTQAHTWFGIDSQPPAIRIINPDQDGLTFTVSTPTFIVEYEDSLSGIDLSSLSVSINVSPMNNFQSVDDLGFELLSDSLIEGAYEFKVTISDLLGQTASSIRPFDVDLSPPPTSPGELLIDEYHMATVADNVNPQHLRVIDANKDGKLDIVYKDINDGKLKVILQD
ncbi:MAG: S8 family serine peptidase [Planctomycetes bacterium]|nr:S8 family serine peptidase [Planctomycetota bacterium]